MKPPHRERRAAPLLDPHPRIGTPARTLGALLVGWAAVWMYGCGAQGGPRPPRVERPARITHLTVVQIGQNLEVQFSLPQLAVDGERLTKPLEVELLRSVAPQGAGLSRLPEPEVWVHLTREQWQPYAQDGSLSYSAHLADKEFQDWRGKTLVLGVRTLTRGFRGRALESEPSNFVDVPILDVSAPPADVQCRVTEKAVEVEFMPPARTLSGAPVQDLTSYRVYRSQTGRPGSFDLEGETDTPPFRDARFEFGQTYYYQVRAVFGKPGRPALSEASPAVAVTPRDVFPPAPPQGLSGIYAGGAVELIWTANSEGDLAGYNIYRVDGQNARRLNKDLVRTPIYRDTTAAPGMTLTYDVTAVDLSGNESTPSQHEVVETK